MALRVPVVQVVGAGRRAAAVRWAVIREGTREAAEGPGGLLVADHVVGKPDLEAVGGRGVPIGYGGVGPLRATDLVHPPRAPEDQGGKGLAGVREELEVRPDA